VTRSTRTADPRDDGAAESDRASTFSNPSRRYPRAVSATPASGCASVASSTRGGSPWPRNVTSMSASAPSSIAASSPAPMILFIGEPGRR